MTRSDPAPLVVFGGLPGVGKTTLARLVADALHATFLRIDTVEAAVARSGLDATGSPVGYLVASWVALDQLRSRRPVVTDAVNSLEIARVGWRELAAEAGVRPRFVQVVCSDAVEHRRRVEARRPDLDGHVVPTWDQVAHRAWEPLTDEHLRVDNVGHPAPHVAAILDWLAVGQEPAAGTDPSASTTC